MSASPDALRRQVDHRRVAIARVLGVRPLQVVQEERDGVLARGDRLDEPAEDEVEAVLRLDRRP